MKLEHVAGEEMFSAHYFYSDWKPKFFKRKTAPHGMHMDLVFQYLDGLGEKNQTSTFFVRDGMVGYKMEKGRSNTYFCR